LSPSLKTAHEIGINDPEECLVWMAHTLICYLFIVVAHVPDYSHYLFKTQPDARGVYRWHKYVLQILQMRYPQPGKHWVLKTPAHMQYLETLIETYPDCIIVWNHRQLNQTLPSTCSLMTHFQTVTSKYVDYKTIGEIVGEAGPIWLNSAVEAHKKYPNNFHDLQFEDLVKDPIGAMKAIYTRYDMKWDGEVQRALETKFKQMPRHKHGEHKYSMEMFGLNNEQISGNCQEYVDTYTRKKGVVSPSKAAAAQDATLVEDS
jgi:hypothetical protein